MANSLTPRVDRLEPNLIINGAMELAQRGSSGLALNAYTLDRFYVENQNSSMTAAAEQSTTVPTGGVFSNSLRVSNSTTGSLAADTEVNIRYRVEGYDILSIWKRTSTLAFWARSSVAATYWVALRNVGATHSYVRSYTLAANTWTLVTMDLSALNTVPGTLSRTNGIGLEITWSIVDGDNFKTGTTESWHAGDFNRGSGPSNSAWLTSGNEFLLTGVMLIPGDRTNADDLAFVGAGKNFQEELALAQRYYEKNYNLAIAPGTNIDGTREGAVHHRSGGTTGFYTINFKSTKRTDPSVDTWTPAGVSGSWRDDTSAANRTTGFVGSGAVMHTLTIGSTSSGNLLVGYWVADAEL